MSGEGEGGEKLAAHHFIKKTSSFALLLATS